MEHQELGVFSNVRILILRRVTTTVLQPVVLRGEVIVHLHANSRHYQEGHVALTMSDGLEQGRPDSPYTSAPAHHPVSPPAPQSGRVDERPRCCAEPHVYETYAAKSRPAVQTDTARPPAQVPRADWRQHVFTNTVSVCDYT